MAYELSGELMLMLVWCKYDCHNGHSWQYVRRNGEHGSREDATCEFCGQEAVVAAERPAAPYVSVVFMSAGTVDLHTDRVGGEGKTLLGLLGPDGELIRLSERKFTLQEAQSRGGAFRNLDVEAACRRWDRLGMVDQLAGRLTIVGPDQSGRARHRRWDSLGS